MCDNNNCKTVDDSPWIEIYYLNWVPCQILKIRWVGYSKISNILSWVVQPVPQWFINNIQNNNNVFKYIQNLTVHIINYIEIKTVFVIYNPISQNC